MKKWHLWKDGDRSPYMNMAVDELLLEESKEFEGLPLLRVYGWNCPSVSIGYVQKYEAAPQEGYEIVRRPTGGGVVYHDRDLTYTVVVPIGHEIMSLDRIESYHVLHRAIVRALAAFGLEGRLSDTSASVPDRATMQCFVSPTKYDVMCGNRKVAGAAQRRTRYGILHQGSVSLDVADGDWQKLADEIINGFIDEFDMEFIDFQPSQNFIEKAGIISSEKYSVDGWNKKK